MAIKPEKDERDAAPFEHGTPTAKHNSTELMHQPM